MLSEPTTMNHDDGSVDRGASVRLRHLRARLCALDLPRFHLKVMANHSVEALFRYAKEHPLAVIKRDANSATALDVALMLGRNKYTLEAMAAMGCETYLSDQDREALASLYCRAGLPALALRGASVQSRRRMLESVALLQRDAELERQEQEQASQQQSLTTTSLDPLQNKQCPANQTTVRLVLL